MQKLKKSKLLLFAICCLALIPTVKAISLNNNQLGNVFYENDNGIKISKSEYDIINEAYGKDYFEQMTQEDYEWFKDLFVDNNKVEVSTSFIVGDSINGASHATASKKISIIKSCSNSQCTMVTTTTWLKNPTIRSYDVIGARFNGTSLSKSSITTRVQSSDGVEYFDNLKQYSSGFGVSVKLPSNATNIIVDQKFYVKTGGTVFASYQHATKKISLATSKLYTLGANGYGNVFCFYGDALGVFDQMAGVNITL